ncbi:hypothetical protein Tco_1170681, partial [Tanacetum coccineum]
MSGGHYILPEGTNRGNLVSNTPKGPRLLLNQRRSSAQPFLRGLCSPSGPTTLVADETVHEERGDSVERGVTTATSLDAEQDSGNIIGPNPRQYLMILFLRELVQVVVPGAKKPWEIPLLRLGLRG